MQHTLLQDLTDIASLIYTLRLKMIERLKCDYDRILQLHIVIAMCCYVPNN